VSTAEEKPIPFKRFAYAKAGIIRLAVPESQSEKI